MENHPNEHHSDDGWTYEENKLFEEAEAEFDNAINDFLEKNGGKQKKEEIMKRTRARAIPWKEEEHK